MRVRLVLSYLLVILVGIASLLLIAQQGAASEVHMFMRGSMMGVDQLAFDLEAYYQVANTWQGAESLLENGLMGGRGYGMMMNGGGPRLRLADAKGTILADTRAQPQGALTIFERQAAIQLHDSRGALIGYLLAESGGFTESALLQRLVRAGLIAGIISLALALILGLFLSYQILKPVEDLTQAAARMAGGDLSQRVRVRGKDEIGTLGRAFNQMAASLQQVEEHRRAVTADIAHELRTPIAIQRAHLEALQDGIYAMNVENLEPVLAQTELLTRLVEDLRTLALADSGELHLEKRPLDLAALVRQVVERFRPEADNHQIQLIFSEGAGAGERMDVDPNRIEQILNNLLSNALRYTPESGKVEIELSRQPGWLELRVADSGAGIPQDALPHIFERFYRADSARSRAAGGSGLGLAIARQLALAHGGDLTASNRAEGGALFILHLPL